MHMKSLRRILVLVGSLLSLPLCTALAGEEQQNDLRAAQREIQSLFRSGQLEGRATAMRQLTDLPPLDAARLVLELGRDARGWRFGVPLARCC